MYSFEFRGGTFKNSRHVGEKFILFSVVGRTESFLYQSLKNGLVEKRPAVGELVDKFETEIQTWKLFLGIGGFGLQRHYYNLYLDLVDDKTVFPSLTIKPLSQGVESRSHLDVPEYIFKGKARVLTRDEALEVCSDQSRMFLEKGNPMPVALMRRISEIDHSSVREGVRMIRTGRSG